MVPQRAPSILFISFNRKGKFMKKSITRKVSIFVALTMMAMSFSITAQTLSQQFSTVKDTTVWTLPVNDIILKRNGDLMTVGLDMRFADYKLKGDKVALFTPILKNGEDSVVLNSVGLYSRIRYIQYLREEKRALTGDSEYSYPYKKRPDLMEFSQTVEYADWMNGATLYLRRSDYGCCHTNLDNDIVPLAKWYETSYTPPFNYVTDIKAETVKLRELRGRAYVDFPVNKIVIYPDYRNNTYELGKIIATIDSVKKDKDITVRSLHIAGTASPEGPYENNVYLAKNRTLALKDYVRKLYDFPEGFITTSYEPVDWNGLREWLENNAIENREDILAIVNSNIEPFARNSKIKNDYPVQYKWLLSNVYPSLRHSDYRIEYTIRQFTDIEEIREIINTQPQKLSLNEIYLLANSLEPGSEEYNEVFETAVRLFPSDETANINAANVAMQQGDLNRAEKYLARAGQSNEVRYALGLLNVKKGNYDEAIEIFTGLADEMPKAAESLRDLLQILSVEN